MFARRIRRSAVIALVVTLPACATARSQRRTVAALEAVTAPAMLLGINEGPVVPPEVAAHYCGYNREFIVRAPVKSAADATLALGTIASCPRLKSLWLVEKDDLAVVRELAPGVRDHAPWGIELGNELDLAGRTPQQFAAWVRSARQLLRDAGYVGIIVTGGVYSVDGHQPQDFEEYVRPAIDACPDCYVGLHWYGDTSEYWLSRVQHLGVPAMVTEFGLPSCTPAQDAAQRTYTQQQLAAYEQTGKVVASIFYQHNSADVPCNNSDTSHLAHFGLQRPDGTYKPVDALFKAPASRN
jgi:hypothetical protein